jgi:hypothetical protein
MSLIVEPTILTVIQNPTTIVRVGLGNAISIPASSQAAVITLPGPFQVVTIGTQGPPGPPGTGNFLQAIAGANIAIFTAVVMVNGLLLPADPTNVVHSPLFVGITITSALTGHSIKYATSGELDGMLGLNPGQRYYVGLNGSLSLSYSAPGATWKKFLGQAKTTTSFILLPGTSVLL